MVDGVGINRERHSHPPTTGYTSLIQCWRIPHTPEQIDILYGALGETVCSALELMMPSRVSPLTIIMIRRTPARMHHHVLRQTATPPTLIISTAPSAAEKPG